MPGNRHEWCGFPEFFKGFLWSLSSFLHAWNSKSLAKPKMGKLMIMLMLLLMLLLLMWLLLLLLWWWWWWCWCCRCCRCCRHGRLCSRYCSWDFLCFSPLYIRSTLPYSQSPGITNRKQWHFFKTSPWWTEGTTIGLLPLSQGLLLLGFTVLLLWVPLPPRLTLS